ncbi:uncharacterized protein M6B38_283635 [Iris pallida]|uniref:Aminotransferase class V domain-containing protein n=1 Tax=Iris pallida TaxID=29817 RepID=A0AAX6I0K4_IRIPA|nr:uncharacterized protein M6B38_283635 [Iris pallida]
MEIVMETYAKGSVNSEKTTRAEEEEEKLRWLSSQIIGGDTEFQTPFGTRVVTYADHTASGRCLRYVEDYIVQHVLPFYGNTHTTDSFVGTKTTKMVDEATEYIRRCMGAGPDDALIFCGSGTTAAVKRLQEVMGIAVPSTARGRLVGSLRDEERWVVFLGPHEHHSNLLSWRQSTAEVVEIGMDRDGLVDVEALTLELDSPKYARRPMLGSFSACSNVTGIVTDTRALARLLHRHGAFACFDFAASAPYVEIDMRSGEIEGYDAVFLSPHKFVGGPGTPGILMMNRSLYHLGSAPPSTCGGGTVGYVNGISEQDTIYYTDIEEREDAGTPPIIQKVRAALAFWLKEYVGYDLIDRRETRNIETALERLLPNPNIWVLGNLQVKRLPVLSFLVFPPGQSHGNSPSNANTTSSGDDDDDDRIGWKRRSGKPLNARFVAKLLSDLFGIQARGGCNCAGPYGHRLLGVDDTLSVAIRSLVQKGYQGLKPGWTRISFAYYMSKEEVDFILASVEFVAAYGHRFLPLYHFDWITGDWTCKDRAFADPPVSTTAFGSTTRFSNKFHRGGLKKVKKQGSTHKAGSQMREQGSSSRRLASYLEAARRIALSLPDSRHQMMSSSVPEEIKESMVLFRL